MQILLSKPKIYSDIFALAEGIKAWPETVFPDEWSYYPAQSWMTEERTTFDAQVVVKDLHIGREIRLTFLILFKGEEL